MNMWQVIAGAAQLAAHLESVQPRHHHIEDQGVGSVAGDQVEGFESVLRQLDRVAVERKRSTQRFAYSAIIVDDKYAHSHSVIPLSESDLRGAPMWTPARRAADTRAKWGYPPPEGQAEG